MIFGSAAVEPKKANDIDLLIIGDIKKEKIKEFEKKFQIHIHLINIDKLENITETLRKEIIKKHLIIQASEDIVRWMI